MSKFKFTSFAVLAVVGAALIVSCASLMGPNFGDQKEIDQIVMKKIAGHLNPQTPVFHIDFRDPNDFTKTMSLASVYYYSSSSEEVKCDLIPLQGNQPVREIKVTGRKYEGLTAENGIKLEEIDFSQIGGYVQTGVAMLKAEGMSYDGIAFYQITVDKKTLECTHAFALESKANTELNSGGRIQTNYYEIEFEVDSQGNVKAVE